MGQIEIVITGSFAHQPNKTVSAIKHGHAAAVARAITFLADEIMPEAIKQDHELHDDNEKPHAGFGTD